MLLQFIVAVGEIANSGIDELRGLSFGFKELQMSLGGLMFYLLLTGNMFINFSLAVCLVSVVGILVGNYIAFLMLERREVFPGLPVSIELGVTLGFLASLIL
jgi:hypothetical protein